MSGECEREHQEMRQAATATQVALAGMGKELEMVRSILSGMTGILQENLVTVASHDKASQDWRETLLAKAESAVARIDQIEQSLVESNRFHEEQGTLVRGLLGLEQVSNPTPLARDIKEVLAIVRGANDLDPDTGRNTSGWTWWAPRFKDALAHGVALAVLALAINLLLPYLKEEIGSGPHLAVPTVASPSSR